MTSLQAACYGLLEFVFAGHAGMNHNNLALVKTLCTESRIKINPDVISTGKAALHMVCCGREFDLEQDLVYNPFRTEIVLGLLDMGASIDLQDNFAGEHGKATPLMYACSHGWVGCIKALMRNGANHEAKNVGGTDAREFALHYVNGQDHGNMRVLNAFEVETRSKSVPYERLGCTKEALTASFMIDGNGGGGVPRLR